MTGHHPTTETDLPNAPADDSAGISERPTFNVTTARRYLTRALRHFDGLHKPQQAEQSPRRPLQTKPFRVERTDAGVTISGRDRRHGYLPTDGSEFTLTLRYAHEGRLLRDIVWHHGWDHTRHSYRLGALQIGDILVEKPALMTRLRSEWSQSRPTVVTPVIYWEARRPEGHLLFEIPLTLTVAAQLHDDIETLSETLPRDPDRLFG